MSYSERDLTADFSRFRRKNPNASKLAFTFALELKLKHNKEKLHIIRDFQPQQIPTLIQASKSCVYHKISDQGMALKPFDSFQICYSPAFVGVCWYVPRLQKRLYLCEVKHFETWLETGYNKITEAEIAAVALFIFDLWANHKKIKIELR